MRRLTVNVRYGRLELGRIRTKFLIFCRIGDLVLQGGKLIILLTSELSADGYIDSQIIRPLLHFSIQHPDLGEFKVLLLDVDKGRIVAFVRKFGFVGLCGNQLSVSVIIHRHCNLLRESIVNDAAIGVFARHSLGDDEVARGGCSQNDIFKHHIAIGQAFTRRNVFHGLTDTALQSRPGVIRLRQREGKLFVGQRAAHQRLLRLEGHIASGGAGIIEALKNRGFIEINKKQTVKPTELGKELVRLVKEFDDNLVSPIKTAEIEADLEEIANGKDETKIKSDFEKYIDETTNHIKEIKITTSFSKYETFECPFCKEKLSYGKFGYFCKPCNFSISNEICGHKITKTDITNLLQKGETTKLKFISKNKTNFQAKLRINKTTHKTEFVFD